MREIEPKPIPVSWLSKDDLHYCRPDLKASIDNLDQGDVALIADKLGDALQDLYWQALNMVLADYLGVKEHPPESPSSAQE